MANAAATNIQANADRLRVVELAIQVIGFVTIAVIFYLAVQAVQTANVSACTQHDTLTSGPGYVLAAIAAGGFVVGRLVGWFRSHVRKGLRKGPRSTKDLPSKPGVALEVALVLFLAVGAVLLGYETWSVANGGNPPPITSYVRCAAYHQLLLASVTAAFIGFMVSNWIWYPTE